MEKKTLPHRLENQKLILKKHAVDRAYDMYAAIDKDRERLRKFLPWVDHIKSVDNEVWYINECLKDWEQNRMFDYAMFNHDGEYLGNLGVHTIQWQWDCCELGYWIVSGHEGKGYISSAVTLLEKTVFEAGFNRIEIRCDPENKKSGAVPKRNGFTFEGIFRQDKIVHGEYRDTAIYSKIKADLKLVNHSR